MGVLKNDVGRPSNKTIKTRAILKGICLIVVALAFMAGGYYLNDYQKKNDKEEEPKVEMSSELKAAYSKYKADENIEFIRSTSADSCGIPMNIKNGVVYSNKKIEKIKGFKNNAKYIATYGGQDGGCTGDVVVITKDNRLFNLFLGDADYKEIKFAKKIVDIFKSNDDGWIYALTEDGKAYVVNQNKEHQTLYEDRVVCISGGLGWNIYLKVVDKTIEYINEERYTLKYLDSDAVVKYVIYVEDYIYAVNENDDLLITDFNHFDKPGENFMLANDKKVKKVVEDGSSVTIMYTNGTSKTLSMNGFVDVSTIK